MYISPLHSGEREQQSPVAGESQALKGKPPALRGSRATEPRACENAALMGEALSRPSLASSARDRKGKFSR